VIQRDLGTFPFRVTYKLNFLINCLFVFLVKYHHEIKEKCYEMYLQLQSFDLNVEKTYSSSIFLSNTEVLIKRTLVNIKFKNYNFLSIFVTPVFEVEPRRMLKII
jgi:hypothetical protein